jgi:hypothetical protein
VASAQDAAAEAEGEDNEGAAGVQESMLHIAVTFSCCLSVYTCVVCVQGDAAAGEVDDDDGADFLLKDNGDDLDLRLERLEVGHLRKISLCATYFCVTNALCCAICSNLAFLQHCPRIFCKPVTTRQLKFPLQSRAGRALYIIDPSIRPWSPA